MMGSGKSAIGPLLAERLGRPFIDTDAEIERRSGRSVAAIFAEDGEEAFRALEAREIEAAAGQGAVVALGGGAIAQKNAAERLAATGEIVYLRARPETLLERMRGADTRPLLAGLGDRARLERLRELLAARAETYAEAGFVVDVDDDLPAALAERIEAVLKTGAAARETGET